MGLQNPVNFRTSQPNAAAMLAAAPQKADTARDQERFERHLDDNAPRDTDAADRLANRRERDRAAESRAQAKRSDDTQTTDSDATQASDTPAVTPDTDNTVSALATAPAKTDDASADAAPKATEKPSETDAVAVVQAPVELVTQPKADDDKTADPLAAKPDVTDPKSKQADEPAAKVDPKVADLAAQSTVPTGHHTETRKNDVKAPKADQKLSTAPVPASLTPLVAAANKAEGTEAPKATATDTDPDAGLVITAKDSSGHEAAAKSADKADTKAGAAQQANSAAQAQPQNAAAASPAQSFAKMLASATGSEVTSITASGTDSAPASLSDLQNVSTTTTQTNNTATVRIGTLPGQTTPTQVPAMAIALQVARNLQKGVNRFDIRLDPAEMGRIDVRMEVKKDGSVAAHLIVERPETLDLLRRDASSLQQALSDAGLQANNDSLNFSLRDDNSGNSQQDFTSNLSGNGGVSKGDTQPDEIVMSPVYNVNLSANGGVDIRI